MTAALAIEHTYNYPFLSVVRDGGLRLATSGGPAANPHFFEGTVLHPEAFGRLLLTVADVVSSRWFVPMTAQKVAAMRDPVVTVHEEVIRFEGFSGCCGVYARADIPESVFRPRFIARGTTNVDFNQPMRSALAHLRAGDTTEFAVGAQEVLLRTEGAGEVVERKVKLPVRWVKGFGEVQAYLAKLEPKWTVSGAEFRRFLRSVPRSQTRSSSLWLEPAGNGIRIARHPGGSAVHLRDIERLHALDGLAPDAREVRVWHHGASSTSGWEIRLDAGAAFVVFSAERARGFSGEGQLLSDLSSGVAEQAVARVRGALRWQAHAGIPSIASACGASTAEVQASVAALASRGLIGYDPAMGGYFDRELPFDMGKIDEMHPRLVEARSLVARGGVRRISSTEWGVQGTDVEHQVRLGDEGDRCTCRWHVRHGGERGPCKHLLAAHLVADDDA